MSDKFDKLLHLDKEIKCINGDIKAAQSDCGPSTWVALDDAAVVGGEISMLCRLHATMMDDSADHLKTFHTNLIISIAEKHMAATRALLQLAKKIK